MEGTSSCYDSATKQVYGSISGSGCTTCWSTEEDEEIIEEAAEVPSCGYHHCGETFDVFEAYELGWQNFGQAWNIYWIPNATYGQRFVAGAYMSYWGGAHLAGAIGTGGLICSGFATCLAAANSTLGIGNVACGGDVCASEITNLATYYPPNMGFSSNPSLTTLNPGTLLSRYGGTSGQFLSPAGTPNWARALPPGASELPLHVYEVVKPLTVWSGTASSWFGQFGGGTQYYLGFGVTVQNLINLGVIK
jgi:hypothetical protein